MTVLQWTMGYKGMSSKSKKEWNKTKAISGCDQLGRRLGSIMRENNSNEMLLRQQAGLDRSKQVSKRRCLSEPSAYKFQREYERNRKQKLRQMAKTQRQLREFHSHPVPNFHSLHKRLENRNRIRQLVSQHKVTTPKAPLTLIKSMESQKKREIQRLKLEQQKLKQLKQRSKFCTKSFDTWRQKPFVPRIQSSFIQAEPFQLVSEERSKKRREFDERAKHEQHQRWRRQAAAWAQRWHEEYLQLRNLTNFKARPNPCKRFKA
ncbi:targeting protein for Xklp2 [Drosophila innubila]|uniref:targeting protein for Xklp2 n=1 Tax=Drosophila innubila TaxID=198719 RepID=UPI00148CC4B9|nr:targeting protein for Xklp2 [Drosophila innubila]